MVILTPQMSMIEVLELYAPRPSSVLEATETTASSCPALPSKAAPRAPVSYSPSEDVYGSLLIRDANRI